MKKLNVMYQTSGLYSPVAAASIYSLLQNNRMFDEISIYYLDGGLSNLDKNKIKKIVDEFNRSIIFIDCSFIDKELEMSGIKKWSGSYATFYKLFIIEKLAVDRILYIDSDTIIEKSLEGLCDFKFDNAVLGMAYSAITGTVKKYYKLNKWYNAGVIFFDVNMYKLVDATRRIKKALLRNESKKLTMIGDESLINVLFENEITPLRLEYNFESSWWLWGWNDKLYKKLGFDDNTSFYSIDTIKSMKNNKIIVHYTSLTTGRPWDLFNDNRAKKEFRKYYKAAGYTERLDFYKGSQKKKSIIYQFVLRLYRRLMPMNYRSVYGFNLHDNAWKETIYKTS